MRHDVSKEPLLCVTGLFQNVACFDPRTLRTMTEIPTPKWNYRVGSIPAAGGREEELIAIGQFGQYCEGCDLLFRSPRETKKIHSPHLHGPRPAFHASYVRGLSYVSPRLVVSGSADDPQLLVSDVSSGGKVMDLKDAPENTMRITASDAREGEGGASQGNGFVFVGGSGVGDRSIRHYDLGRSERANEVVKKLKAVKGRAKRTGAASGLAYSTERNLLFSSSAIHRSLRIWSVQDATCLQELQLSNRSHSLLYDPKKGLVFCGLRGGTIDVWDSRQTKKRVLNFDHPTEDRRRLRIPDLAQVGDGTYASIGDRDFSVAIWTDRGKILATAKTKGKNYGVCSFGSVASDTVRPDDADRLEYLLKTCYVGNPTESVQVAGFLVGRALLLVP